MSVVHNGEVHSFGLGGDCIPDNPIDDPAVIMDILSLPGSNVGITQVAFDSVVVVLVEEFLQDGVDHRTSEDTMIIIQVRSGQ